MHDICLMSLPGLLGAGAKLDDTSHLGVKTCFTILRPLMMSRSFNVTAAFTVLSDYLATFFSEKNTGVKVKVEVRKNYLIIFSVHPNEGPYDTRQQIESSRKINEVKKYLSCARSRVKER